MTCSDSLPSSLRQILRLCIVINCNSYGSVGADTCVSLKSCNSLWSSQIGYWIFFLVFVLRIQNDNPRILRKHQVL
uniref:Uncharacterized protein n=1 Tax=Physcomitrium patens TaxID=3218 RepID=A0A2K1IVN1_PHYPA|nr:hypothetical protein PHYPA_025278 [Physcomitrium patens]